MSLWVHFLLFLAIPSAAQEPPTSTTWEQCGLTDEQAAVHLLNRFAFGPTPAALEQLLSVGHDRWLEEQLAAPVTSPEMTARLADFPDLLLAGPEVAARYPPRAQVERRARDAGYLGGDGINDGVVRRADLQRYMEDHGLERPAVFVMQAVAQKSLRAIHSRNQLHERLVDFWFNHFNVSADKTPVLPHIVDYERRAIAPHALGPFRSLLGATATHPAMLHYLDNALSRSPSQRILDAAARRGRPVDPERTQYLLNENYARELLELHTLGVDGGYTEVDVRNVARAFTGWSVVPVESRRRRRHAGAPGSFTFIDEFHDTEPKSVLGLELPGDGGIDEGRAVLDLLATHPSTATFICRKLAVYFVSDDPSAALVAQMARVFGDTDGDIGAVLRVVYGAPEFWTSRHLKTKTPFELVVSAIRATEAEVTEPLKLGRVMVHLGHPLYRCSPPTGFPLHAEPWLNAGTALDRINFGLAFADGRSTAYRVGHGIPEKSADEWRRQLLPGREPVIRAPGGSPHDHLRGRAGSDMQLGLLLASVEFQER